MTVARSAFIASFRRPKERVIAGATAAAVTVGVTFGIILATGGGSTPATGGLLPLAPDTGVDVPIGVVQLEPGDPPAIGGLLPLAPDTGVDVPIGVVQLEPGDTPAVGGLSPLAPDSLVDVPRGIVQLEPGDMYAPVSNVVVRDLPSRS